MLMFGVIQNYFFLLASLSFMHLLIMYRSISLLAKFHVAKFTKLLLSQNDMTIPTKVALN